MFIIFNLLYKAQQQSIKKELKTYLKIPTTAKEIKEI